PTRASRLLLTSSHHTPLLPSFPTRRSSDLRFENLVRCGPAQGGEVCRNHATLSSVTSLKRLRHCAKILPQSGRVTCGNSKSADDMLAVEVSQFCACRCAAENATRSGRVKAVLVVPRCNSLGDFAFHLHSNVVCKHQVLPADFARPGISNGKDSR